MLLLEKLNKKDTINNVKAILMSCRSYSNILGDNFSYMITPDYMFKISFKDISDDNKTKVAIQAEEVLLDVFKAINKLSDATRRRLIYEKYIVKRKEKDLYIANKLNFSTCEFYRILDTALLEFSEVYNFGELMMFN